MGIAGRPTIVDLNVLAGSPSQRFKRLLECHEIALTLGVVLGTRYQYANSLLAIALLRKQSKWPVGHHPAGKSYEGTPLHYSPRRAPEENHRIRANWPFEEAAHVRFGSQSGPPVSFVEACKHPSRPQRLHDRIKPIGQRRRSRLQDQRRFDLDDAVVAHRRDFIPAGPLPDTLRHDLLAAP